MGGAYAKGYVKELLDYAKDHKIEGVIIAFEADFSPYQTKGQKAVKRKIWEQLYSIHIRMMILRGANKLKEQL